MAIPPSTTVLKAFELLDLFAERPLPKSVRPGRRR